MALLWANNSVYSFVFIVLLYCFVQNINIPMQKYIKPFFSVVSNLYFLLFKTRFLEEN